MLKVMAKMGISTYQSYCGAQIFDVVGLRSDFVKQFFTGTHSQVEGVGLDEIAQETAKRHRLAFSDIPALEGALDVGGEYAYRVRGEAHMWRPASSPICSTPCAAICGEVCEPSRSRSTIRPSS